MNQRGVWGRKGNQQFGVQFNSVESWQRGSCWAKQHQNAALSFIKHFCPSLCWPNIGLQRMGFRILNALLWLSLEVLIVQIQLQLTLLLKELMTHPLTTAESKDLYVSSKMC